MRTLLQNIQQNNENEYELVRFSSNINVVGGFSKLLKYSILKIKDMQKSAYLFLFLSKIILIILNYQIKFEWRLYYES